jgi:DNA-binding beta-propeller fold protein YncE
LLYVYSPLQALQQYLPTTPTPTNPQFALSEPANAIAFSPNGAFAFVAESSSTTGAANLTAFATCNNQLAATLPLPNLPLPSPPPLMMKVLPDLHITGTDSFGNKIPDGIHIAVLDPTGVDIVTATIAPPSSPGTLCPQTITLTDTLHPMRRIELGQGTLHPLNFFASADGTELYLVNAGSSTILVYNFSTGSLAGGIELAGNATPLSADMSADAGTIVISGSDGMLHEVSTQNGGIDLLQLSFPNLPDYQNAFCSFTPSTSPCTLDAALAKP